MVKAQTPTAAAPATPHGCTNLKLRQLTRRVSAALRRRSSAPTGLKTTQYSLLSHVIRLGPMRPGDLAAAMKMDASTLTRNLQPLVAAGWVEVGAGRRRRAAAASAPPPAGRAKRAEAQRDWKRAQLALNARLGEARVVALHALLDDCLATARTTPRRPSMTESVAIAGAPSAGSRSGWCCWPPAGIFALTMGARQSMGLFLSVINTTTGLGLASISLAFAFGQLWWGLTQPVRRHRGRPLGAGRVLLRRRAAGRLGTALTPLHDDARSGLIFAIGVLAAGGAGMAGPSVLMAATTRLIAAGQARHRHRHRQRRRLVRPVRVRADRRRASPPALGWARDAEPGG